MNLPAALLHLDHANDDHWTEDGLPRVDVVNTISDGKFTRQQITDAAPSLVRNAPEPKGDDVAELLGEESSTQAVRTKALEKALVDPGAKAPDGDTIDAGYVVPEDDVVGMTPTTVFGNIELIDRALAEFERQSVVLSRRRDAAHNSLKALGVRSAQLNKVRAVLAKSMPSARRTAVQDYLAAQREARAGRAARAQRFIDAGTTAADVAKQLQTGSQLDTAMRHRKPGRGTARPAIRTPVKTTD